MKFQRLARTVALVPFACLALGLPVPLPFALATLALAAALSVMLDRDVRSFATLDDARRQRLAESRRNRLSFAFRLGVLIATPALVVLSLAPSLSSEDALPDVSGLKAFSAECNYMSREGYLIFLARQRGIDLSRAEARRIVSGRSARASRAAHASSRAPRAASRDVRPMPCGCLRGACGCGVLAASRGETRVARLERLRDEARLRHAARYAPHPLPGADARSRRAYESAERRLAAVPSHYRGRRVAILPFERGSTRRDPGDRVERELARDLQARGYEVVTLPRHLYREALSGGIGPDEMRHVADSLGVDHVISGRVTKFNPYRKVRLAGLLLGGVLTGVHGYGDVALEGGLYSRADHAWQPLTVDERSRRQLLGWAAHSDDMLDESLRRASARFASAIGGVR